MIVPYYKGKILKVLQMLTFYCFDNGILPLCHLQNNIINVVVLEIIWHWLNLVFLVINYVYLMTMRNYGLRN